MSEWKRIIISKEFLGKRTTKSVLVFFPDGKYKDWSCWVPSKLVREIDDSSFSVSTKYDFEYKVQLIIRDEHGCWKTLKEDTMNGEEFIRQFS